MLDLAKCFSHSRDLGFVTDSRGVILAATAGTERALGFSQVELVGQELSHLDETGDLRRFFESLPVRSRMNLGFHLRTKPGAVLTVSALATSLRDEAGEPVGWFLAAQDLKGAVGESRGAQPILDALIDSIGAALWSFDRNGTVLTWSRACETEFSVPREQAEGKLSAERLFASPEQFRGVIETVDQAGRFSGELALRGPGGALRPTHLSVTPLVSSGLPVGYSAVSIDIAERKRAEELKRTYFEQAGGAILVVDLETLRVVDANARASEMNGYPREELIGLHVSALRSPDAPDSDEVIGRALQEKGRYVNDRELARRKDGSVFPCAVDLRRITVGGKSYSVTVVHDLTAQRRAEEFQRVLFEQAGEAILVVDQGTLQVIDANARVCEMHGYTREEFLRLRVPDFVAPQDLATMEAVGRSLAETGRYDGQQFLRRKDGSVFPCALNLRTVTIPDRLITVCVYRDLTEQLKAQEFFRVLFEKATDAVYLVADEGLRVVEANEAACRLLGYTHDEFLKLGVIDLVPPPYRNRISEYHDSVRNGSGYRRDRRVLCRKDGGVVATDHAVSRVEISGKPYYMASCRDLTDQERAARELEEAKAFLEHVQENASDGLALLDENGLYVAVNQKFLEWWRARREDFIGTPWMKNATPEQLEGYRHNWDRLMKGERISMRTTIDPPGGPQVVVDVRSAMILRGDRKFVFSIVRDVTDQVKSEEALRRSREDLERHVAERTGQLQESEERFRSITEATPSPVTITRPDGEILYVNEAAAKLFGLGPEGFKGRNALDYYADPSSRNVMRDRLLREGTVEGYELKFKRPDGSVFWTLVNLRVLTFLGGPAILGSFLDIDDRKRAEEALLKATEELERRVVERTAELARANALLYEEIVERKRAENVLRLILEGTAAVTGGSFFRSLARHLGSALNVRYAVVVQGLHQPAGQARTIAFWDGKDFISPLDYPLAGTPCEDVMGGEACSYSHDVQRLFPDDRMLVDLNIQSYLGVPMMDSAGTVVGLLSVMDEKPVSDEELKLSVLKIFAARAGIELERQVAEEALRESEERWRSLVTNAPDIILTVDREGRILSINRTITGARISDVVGRRVQEYVPPDVVPRVNAALETAFRDGKASSYETLSQGPNGTSAWYITRVGPVKVGDQVTCATFIATDITERWKGERRQKVQHEVTRVLAEAPSLQVAAPRILRHFCEELGWQVGNLWWVDRAADVLRLADTWHAPLPAYEEYEKSARVLTFQRGSGVVGAAWSRREAMWTSDVEQDPLFLRSEVLVRAGLRSQFVLPVDGPQGVFGVLEFFSQERRERDEQLLQLASTLGSQIGQFIERKRAEEDLRFQKSLLESQSEAAIDGILVVSRDGVMTSFNRRFCQMWDIPEEVIQSRTDERALQAVLDKLLDPKEFLDRVRHLYDHPDEESRDEIRLKDGRAFDRYSAPVKGGDGKLYGRVWYFRDITGRKQTEENLRRAAAETRQMYEDLKEAQAQLIRSEKLASIGMLVSGVAHEINNPLNVMYGNLQLLAEVSDVLLPLAVEGARSRKVRGTASRVGKFRGMIRDALKAARHAREIVQDFRNFARDTRTAELVDLNQCLEEAVTLMQRELPQGIRVVRKLGRIPQVRCLRGQISQVFLNLLKNAGEAIEKKGTITLRTAQKDGHAVVEVADSGRGMPEEIRQKLFEPFFTTKPVGKGLGLGLSISAMIVHNHSGRITVRSRPGRGSVFRVELPLPV